MNGVYKVLIVLSMFVSGIVLVPVMGLPTEGFNWQRYAGVYVPPTLVINHPSGYPGSFFTITGSDFTPETTLDISVNGILLGTVDADSNGQLVFLINSTGAEVGNYFVQAVGIEAAMTQFELSENQPLWPQEGVGVIFSIPPDIAITLLRLPVVMK